MNILVTGSKGFVGKNLVENLKNIRDRKNRTRANIVIDMIYEYDIDSSYQQLDLYCQNADFVFNLAGANRPTSNDDYYNDNYKFADTLLECLEKHNNTCPVMLSSSIQASLSGRYANSDYGKSKQMGEQAFFDFSLSHSNKVLVYRFPNLFGKWCKPNYNSVIATFCYNIANDLPIRINNENEELQLVYIDDLVEEMLNALEGKEHKCDYCGVELIPNENGKYCYVPTSHKVKLGDIAALLYYFNEQSNSLVIPKLPNNSFEKKLYSTFVSYLPKSKMSFSLKSNIDDRGSFTELIKSLDNGQISVNISKPGITKGQHWHNSKWELFIVVYGHALIQERKIGTDEVIEFEVSGSNIEAVYMLPGYTHNIINLSDTEELITIMWANELFDNNRPDTFSEIV